MAPKKPTPEPKRRQTETVEPRRRAAKPQPLVSEDDLAMLAKNYKKLGFKKDMTDDELREAMDKLAEETPLGSKKAKEAAKILAKIKDPMSAAVDAVKAGGTVDRNGAPPDELETELQELRTQLEEAMNGADKKTVEASYQLLQFKIKERGMQERQDELAQRMDPPSREMQVALNKADVKPHGVKGGKHRDDADDFEPPARSPARSKALLAKRDDRGGDEPPRPNRRGASLA